VPSYSLKALAEEDLIDVYLRGLDEWGPKQTDKFQEKLVSVFHLLAENPRMGRQVKIRPHLQQHEVKPYVIFYQQVTDGVDIVRVIYKNRLVELHL
jgi:toxin ParE1/3/4